MKKLRFLLASSLVVLFMGCAGLNYTPYLNDPVETKVVLSEANYKIVKEVSGQWTASYVFGIGGLSRKSLEKNAISDMYRNAQLSGNQQIINITTTQSVAVWALGIYVKLCINAHGYVIEFLDENGNSQTLDDYYPQNAQGIDVTSFQQTISHESTIQEQKMASEDEQKNLARMHRQLDKSVDYLYSQGVYIDGVFNIYKKIYKSTKQTEKNVRDLQNIQFVIFTYINSLTKAYPNLEMELKNANSIEEKKKILLSYNK